MDRLPTELVIKILEHTVVAHYGDKNGLLKLRTTCRLFDEVLKPFALRTLQLEFTRLDRAERKRRPLSNRALRRIGAWCEALYIDMMVVRDEGEVWFLSDMFSQVPSMNSFISNLRRKFCMDEESFTELDYRRELGFMLEHAPNLTAVKLNLPFRLVSPGVFRAATMILGNSFEALAQRPDDSEPLKTLVLENLSDLSLVNLWRNPQDVKNIITAFSDLQHLFISARRNAGHAHITLFRHRLWEMIAKAEKLESLCLVDLDADEKQYWDIKTSSQRESTLEDWRSRCFPTIRKLPKKVLPNLACLELRQAEVLGCGFLSMLKSFSNSLRELYLDGVYLKTVYSAESPQNIDNTLWIGLPNVRPSHDNEWIAVYLRQIKAQLRVCRVANLGYDQYNLDEEPRKGQVTYDLVDPSGLSRCLEQRFVEVATGLKQPPAPDGSPVTYLPEEESQDSWALADRERPSDIRIEDWNASYYLSGQHNPTSAWQKSIDGHFPNCNQFTLSTLHDFADNAYNGMTLLNRIRDSETPRDHSTA